MATQSSSAGSGDSGARTYNDAIDALNTLQTPYAIVEARRKAGIRPDASSIAEMHVYLRRIGYAADDLDRLNIVHVAGTKGKGSTCAFTASILSHYQRANSSSSSSTKKVPRRIGLFTSPHLIAVRERIRIDGAPISEAAFARYFFEVWDRLGEAEAREGPLPAIDQRLLLGLSNGGSDNDNGHSTAADPTPAPAPAPMLMFMPPRPIYARFLTLMSFHVFLREGVDAAVYETGIGGEYDATNVVPRPAATGITTLGIDHVFALGRTVAEIAWHKAGIMKPGSPAFTVQQVPEAAAVLARRAAEEKAVDLRVLDVDPRLAAVAVRPDALFQKKNATLAIALAEAALRRLDPEFRPGRPGDALPRAFVDGIEQVVWRGRCEVKVEGPVVWHVDGAHTVDSLRMATRWFADECAAAASSTSSSSSPPPKKALIFNQQGREEAVDFLEGMVASLRARCPGSGPSFDHVIFCSNVTYAQSGYKRDFVNHQHDPAAVKALTAQRAFARRWAALDPASEVEVVPTIEDAIARVRALGAQAEAAAGGGGQQVRAFITGSLHLVGGALGILEGADAL
ncbi:Folylpolyglutamate synthetase [Diatrype stigma]|uniref:Folylpolyglutamate synthase n=1 Tax=Diatrype stigma TaxID=117547 RepID=A0AAN9U8W1_9PEZI